MAEQVEVPLRTWVLVEIFMILMFIVRRYFEADLDTCFYIIVGLLYINVVTLYILSKKCQWIRNQLHAAPLHTPASCLDCITGNGYTVIPEESQALGSSMRSYTSPQRQDGQATPRYLLQAPMTSRSWFGETFIHGDLPNKHEQLFWFDLEGPECIQSYLRMCFLLLAMYIPVVILYFFLANEDFGTALLRLIIAVIPFILSFNQMMDICNCEEINSTEMMRKRKMIEATKAKQLAARMSKIFHCINTLRVASELQTETAMIHDKKINLNDLDPEFVKNTLKIFKNYDTDGSGDLDASEMFRFLRSIGQDPTEEKAELFCKNLDKSRNGKVDCNEFVKWLHFHTTNHTAQAHNIEEISENIFKMFDSDGNGFITRKELEMRLKEFGVKLEEDTMRLLLREVDPNGDGEIHAAEFLEMMEKYHVDM